MMQGTPSIPRKCPLFPSMIKMWRSLREVSRQMVTPSGGTRASRTYITPSHLAINHAHGSLQSNERKILLVYLTYEVTRIFTFGIVLSLQ